MSENATVAAVPETPLELRLDGVLGQDLSEWLSTMLVIREFEESLEALTASGKIPGSVHQASGQEAVAVGVMRALEPGDIVASPHRPHHHALAKGMSPDVVMAELWGRADGCAGGRGGTMHLNDFSLGYFGSNGIVGASLGIAMGAALAAKLRSSGQVCVGFFGEGGANTGRTWEAINFATTQQLPLIAFCENNQYAVETYIGRAIAGPSIAERAAGFGLPAVQIDGQDVCAVYRATVEARERARSGGGPTFVEAITYRYHGHNTGEIAEYRTEQEVEHWRSTRDPIDGLRRALEAGRTARCRRVRAAARARTRGRRGGDRIRGGLTAARPEIRGERRHESSLRRERSVMSEVVTVGRAFQQGLREEMIRDESVFVLGTDLFIRGGHFAQVKGIGPEFGHERVIDAPISEAAMVAAGVGAAMNGMRPVIDLNFIDFAFGAMDEIANQAAKARYLWGKPVPLLIRASSGVALYAAQHNNSLEAWFMHTPGLVVVMPSNARDTKGILKSALRGDDPVIFFMHKRLTGARGEIGGPDELVPIGQAAVVRQGRKATLISSGIVVGKVLRAAEELASDGIDVEVIDLRTIFPLDTETIAASVRKTGRAIVVTEEPPYASVASEIAASLQESIFEYLDAPVARLTAAHAPIPHAPNLMEALLPQVEDIVTTVRRSLDRWPASDG